MEIDRRSQSEMENEKYEFHQLLSDEKRKAEETAEKAKEMIKVNLFFYPEEN